MTHASGNLGDLGAPAKCPAVEDSSYAGESQETPLWENAVDHGLKQKAAIWDLAQVRAVRPGTLCLPWTVPTNALAAVLTSGMVFSAYRDPAAQVADVPLVSWCRMDTACPSPLAAVAFPVPMPHGSWPPPRWSSWTAIIAHASMGP